MVELSYKPTANNFWCKRIPSLEFLSICNCSGEHLEKRRFSRWRWASNAYSAKIICLKASFHIYFLRNMCSPEQLRQFVASFYSHSGISLRSVNKPLSKKWVFLTSREPSSLQESHPHFKRAILTSREPSSLQESHPHFKKAILTLRESSSLQESHPHFKRASLTSREPSSFQENLPCFKRTSLTSREPS